MPIKTVEQLETEAQILADAMRESRDAGDMERAKKMASAYKRISTRARLMRSEPEEYDPNSEAFIEKYGALSENEAANFAAGAGKFLLDTGRGVAQIAGADNQASIDMARERDQELMGSGAGLAGNILGGAAFTAPVALIPGANTVAGTTLAGGALGALQPTSGNESRLFNAGLGAAGGYVGGRIGRGLSARRAASNAARAASEGGEAAADIAVDAAPTVGIRSGISYGTVGDDAFSGLTQGQRDAMLKGRALGMKLTPGEATGNKGLLRLEAKASSQPMSAGPFDRIKDNNQRVLNRTWANAIGVDDDDLSSPVIAEAYEKAQDVFRNMPQKIGRQDIPPNEAFDLLAGLQADFDGVTDTPILKNGLVNDLINLARNGEASGAQLRSLTSRLGKRINTDFTSASGDRARGEALNRVKDFVDDIIERGLSESDQAAYATARQRWRNLSLLLQRTGTLNPSSGDVKGGAMAALLQQKDRGGFTLGRNQSPHYNATRFAQAFKPIVGDSGTATRSPLQITEALASVPLNIAGRAYTSAPSVSAAVGYNSVANDIARMLGPATDPAVMGLLGANTAIQFGR